MIKIIKQEIEVENLPIVDEKQDVVSSKYVLDTLGVDKKQSLNEVATEFIATQKEANKQIVQEAVLEIVEPKVKEKFVEVNKKAFELGIKIGEENAA